MTRGPEYAKVEKPLLDQLTALGWQHIEGSRSDHTASERAHFREWLIESRLRDALRRLNLTPDGEPWLDYARQTEAVDQLKRPDGGRLIEVNEQLTQRLLDGVFVAGLPEWDHGRRRRIRFIDFDHPETNDFLAISQFRMDEPPGQIRSHIVPDVVLFVNGIPLVVIECKNPDAVDPMAEGIDQLRRYANQRGGDEPEGCERLFWTNQFVMSTTGEQARSGSFTAGPEHFLEWKDAAPLSRDQLAERLGKPAATLTGQELLVAGMLTPETLLDLVRHFTLFTEANGRRVKIVARYQQYRAVLKALHRLRTGKTRAMDGDNDRRGGLLWHTQGSGKSFTMVFLVRAMRSDPVLRAFKVVVITDRTDLEKQLSATATLTGEPIDRAKKTKALRKLLAEHGPALVFAMIQKYQDSDTANAQRLRETGDSGNGLGVLNTDESIVILVDEAHRSQASTLHANLMDALPNAAKIGFTGTPIMRDDKSRSSKIFGPYIDRYTIRQAEADGAVVPIVYEGRTTKGAVAGGSDMDELFEDMFADHTDAEIEKLKKRWATTGVVLEAENLIAAKAKSMLWHYVTTVLPGGFKAQVAATSRLATVRYRQALSVARDELVAEIETLPAVRVADVLSGETDIDSLDRRTQGLLRAFPHLALIRNLDFVPVISGDDNDDPAWTHWTAKSRQDTAIAEFKKPLGPATDTTSPVAFLLVRTMLLTGFDAPINQVLYLDRFMRDAELLQAIARVNRTAHGKSVGMLVDYCGVADHLRTALRAYAPEDAADTVDALTSIKDDLPRLRDTHHRVVAVFAQAGIDTFDTDEDVEACVEVLSDEALRARFGLLLKEFLTMLDTVLPRPEGLPYVKDAKRLGVIQKLARRRYRNDGLGDFDPSLYGEKVRGLVDEHIIALDIAKRIPPISITEPDFLVKVQGLTSDKAKASEMEHALRFHIKKNFDADPARFAKLSERLEQILHSLSGQWQRVAVTLESLITETITDDATEQVHPDLMVSRCYGALQRELTTEDTLPDQPQADVLLVAEKIVVKITDQARIVRFWHNSHQQDALRRQLIQVLDDEDLFPFEEQAAVADGLMEFARANQNLIIASGEDDEQHGP